MQLIAENIFPCNILFVGEKPGHQEVQEGRPLVGPSGTEFDKMLTEAGLNRRQCAITNVAHELVDGTGFMKASEAKMLGRRRYKGRYPTDAILRGAEKLPETIRQVRPNVVVPLGEIALWELAEEPKIGKWRGSIMEVDYDGMRLKLVPTYNPAAILKQWPLRWVAVQDLRRVRIQSGFPEVRRSNATKHIRPEYEQAMDWISSLQGKKSAADIETRQGQISCIGFASSKEEGFTLPILSNESIEGYWGLEEEVGIIQHLKATLTRQDTQTIWHNGHYDCQYIAKCWGFLPNVSDDTMIMHHVAFPSLLKSLDFCASLYCEYYCFWKDEGREFDPSKDDEDQHFSYNVDDCLYTWEVYEKLCEVMDAFKMWQQYEWQMQLFRPVLRMMLRGTKIDTKYRTRLNSVLMNQIRNRSVWFEKALGHPLNPNSNPQMKKLFYNDLKMPVVKDKKTGNPTTNDEAMDKFKKKQPLLWPLCNRIQESRSLGVFRGTFIEPPISQDGRIRGSFTIPGTETYRFSARKDFEGNGVNLQTIPKGYELVPFLEKTIKDRLGDNHGFTFDGLPPEKALKKDVKQIECSVRGPIIVDENDPDRVVDEVRKAVIDEEKQIW